MNNNLFDTYLESMNFLNEISVKHPSAISFGSGRPNEEFFNVEEVVLGIKDFVKKNKPRNMDENAYFNYLGQYNFTKGIINEYIAKLVYNDEGITIDSEDIIITDGAQEAMAIVINSLFSSKKDVLMVSEPSYIGFIGYAKIAGVNVCTIKRKNQSIDMDDLEDTVINLIKQGKKPKVLYEVPDFHNPTGSYMPLSERKKIIELAEKYDFYIVEDNPYGYYIYDTEKIPTLKAIDKYKRVIHIGSFSKTIFPSMRLGYLLADGKIKHNNVSYSLSEMLKKVKSFITVNSSVILQAMLGAVLEKENYSLKALCKPKVESCMKNRNILIDTIGRCIGHGLNWQKPLGGFFMSLDIPFSLTDSLILECVEKYSVIVCPMYMFCINKSQGTNQIRIAFSNLTEKQIEDGLERLAKFIRSKS
ncbi:PLP-dependent aminotransferase family protein [Ruminiclostridium josui]|uniref:aminotransferase-like domain-containing protein n=1 Tax=Ruminiclostridium josui TaxID=1499 RepID=UPI000466367F|nr:PLP-dependent aminotransferase family protein [Ruminiclostridium josui]